MIEFLKEQFPDRWAGHGDRQNSPPRSPDLTPLDFHVRSYIKNLYERNSNGERNYFVEFSMLKNTKTVTS